MKNVVALILAGGQGTRLGVLTEKIAKPAVQFGGKYRLIDFTMSNCVNSGIYKIGVLTQYKPHLLNRHIGIGKPWDLDRKDGGVTILQPYSTEKVGVWYKGTADAVYSNIEFVDSYSPDYVVILSGDHIYSMDYNELVDYHVAKSALGTVACMEVPLSEANRFGIMVTDLENRIIEFQEKPKFPKSTLASLGIYVFQWNFIREVLMEDAKDENSTHDFGKDIIPKIINTKRVYAFPFEGYWKDVGTIYSYWESNLELTRPIPPFNIHDENWKIYTHSEEMPPAYISDDARVKNSLISEGCEIYGEVYNSVLAQGVEVGEGVIIKNSVVMSRVRIGNNCFIENAIIAENVVIGNEVKIGVGEFVENKLNSRVYNSEISVIGMDSVIEDKVKIGKNCVVGIDKIVSKSLTSGEYI
ncbi:glucose-1-phosphate adenylyltransferase [Thermosipho melanesiensis]|uniref:Glucose-1-phosphate adenylyltransferase n=2 Tax=Thermosipho melanesiensis TaxID=46541 RepID=GLGC_THEM4|nr:glucose-1-phosphate adenylyltransferase [Thermosipho melanesiensis]A6LJL4.1 RecName: Full=Glucose-1-phosphate adenylyltransferase; AltName: Full=ADP-glucose pyrophosphorylase; Short=ADPGlc PPase; AltName: Full=ADP-glucose synthase [Thermosipho melanesiensis BI429]ABR30115.1 glucose-1-phosphate adenylyltransferase [Thermosipho melanesiensis BI429]APT73312.1 glucose-1-phosphate adenylyltransferase [Thermosipho melanesiensis]OOC38703.1 glucose-1-phosphate adenylyltransferase [Thermosipho melane